MDNNSKEKQIINLTDGEKLNINGVRYIESFDSEYILLDTSSGEISVEGNEMKIESLSDSGDILVKGKILGVFRTPEKASKNGFFNKIFGK